MTVRRPRYAPTHQWPATVGPLATSAQELGNRLNALGAETDDLSDSLLTTQTDLVNLTTYVNTLPTSSGGWFTTTTSTSANATPATKTLVLMDLSTAAANRTVTLPAAPAAGDYVGVKVNSAANGFTCTVQDNGGGSIFVLTVDQETVWVVYNGSTWVVADWYAPDPNFEARFSPLGCWLSSGADANLTDISGNGKTLTKAVTIIPAPGYGLGRRASGFTARYSISDASFRLTAAMSLEMLVCPVRAGVTNGYLLQCGTGAGGATNNLLWSLRDQNDGSGVPRLQFRVQNGVNVNQDVNGPQAVSGWMHVAVTRASNGTSLTFYVNGAATSATAVAPASGATSDLFWGGTSGASASYAQQFGSVWGSELTTAQVSYLAALRLGKRGQSNG